MHQRQLSSSSSEGPQLVTRRGSDAVVILAVADYRRLIGDAPNLIDHLLSARGGEALAITRSKQPIRDLDP